MSKQSLLLPSPLPPKKKKRKEHIALCIYVKKNLGKTTITFDGVVSQMFIDLFYVCVCVCVRVCVCVCVCV